jgi:UDP-N-acetylmuramoyl-L-alanyl-D-glutamate--2,6-diaminopimelate ligase
MHHLLSQMRQHGQSHAAVEVSAQALVRHRVDGLRFEVAGFSNLSRDHLDDFGTMENYLAAKAKLFDSSFSDRAVINVEDEYGLQLYNSVSIPKVGIGEGLDYQASYEDGTLTIAGKADLLIPFSKGFLMSKNFALALVMLLEMGIDKNLLKKAATEIDLQIPGRLERVSDKTPAVYVDYAHTPAGVAAAVSELKSKFHRLVVVLGASGNRDKGKRAEMALACAGAQAIVVTDQHPRDEDPAEIRSTLLEAAKALDVEVVEEANPAKAIATAISLGGDGAVLWCGPGQLKYREIKGEKVPFDAIAVAREAVENA